MGMEKEQWNKYCKVQKTPASMDDCRPFPWSASYMAQSPYSCICPRCIDGFLCGDVTANPIKVHLGNLLDLPEKLVDLEVLFVLPALN